MAWRGTLQWGTLHPIRGGENANGNRCVHNTIILFIMSKVNENVPAKQANPISYRF